MEKLRSLPPHCMQEEVLLPEVSALAVTDALIESESNTQLRKWRENRGELQYRPSRRLPGARQIQEEKLRLNPSLSALLGPPKEAAKKGKEKQKEQDKKREREEREREKKREKEEREERERERKRKKEREKQKEKELKRLQKEKEKAEAKQKKERKWSKDWQGLWRMDGRIIIVVLAIHLSHVTSQIDSDEYSGDDVERGNPEENHASTSIASSMLDLQQDLYRILKAYTVYRPEEGYCQAQAPVAAVLLMHMPAEQAFWCLVQICDKYLPGYYSAGLEAIQLDGEIFFALLRRVCPMAYRHLKKFKIDPILYMTEWFMCIFSRTLPWSSVLRVWDMFFCEGGCDDTSIALYCAHKGGADFFRVKIVFRVGLVLLRHTLGSVDKLRSCQGMYETMEKLRSLPPHCMQEEVLLPEVSALAVTDALIERESNTQLRKWRENRGELQYRPSRRLHGARQIQEEKMRLNPSLSGSRLSLSSLSSLRRPSPPNSPALALQPPESVVVSEGLHPVLPSPTANKAPLGPPKEAAKKGKEKQKEQDKKREREEREREKKREKEEREERERERKREKEREKQKEKEEKRLQKEKEKAEAKQKKERKVSFRRKEASSPATDSTHKSGTGSADDTYF
ncbi:hypothetical protein AB205_0001470 [Aquarana catesbeiana]|uniref:Rab-GAP TBC domain-containing protein n=1 Tax=Aquarana catesbeiana TaxID=8400 RepID=A0A2G9RQB5_AQUCT|nr:hypothetical protein AB205_0001470 [Aquarana catesbeiana]